MGTRLLVFVKAPLPGLVKTRLAAGIGQEAALGAYRALAAGVLAAVDACRLPAVVHYAPAGELPAVAALCGPGRDYRPQTEGDLGARMAAALRQAFDEGADNAILLGCDLPLVTGDILADAAARLAGSDAVLGPALDGGYWAIGFRRQAFCPAAFAGMPWSTDAVAGRTAAAIRTAGWRLALLPELPDCDEAADLVMLAAPPWRARLAGTPLGVFLSGLACDPFDQIPGLRLSRKQKSRG